MSKVYLDDTILTGIANQTRRLTETQDTYTPSEMVTALSTVETGGSPQLNIIPITENMDFNNVAMPSNMKVVLQKNILDYLSAEDKTAIEEQLENDGYASHYFYQYVDIPYVNYDEGEEPPENRIENMNLDLSINENGIYKFSFEGYFTGTGDVDTNEFYIIFSSLDGINFFVSNFSVLKYNDGAEYTVVLKKMEFPVSINFSEIINGSGNEAKGWNDVLSEFLFTIQE